MKIEAFETEFSVEDVVWFMYNNKPVRGIVYEVNVHIKEEANLSWTDMCINIVRKIKSYFDKHRFEKNVSYRVQMIKDDDTYYGVGEFSYRTANEMYRTKEELLKSL